MPLAELISLMVVERATRCRVWKEFSAYGHWLVLKSGIWDRRLSQLVRLINNRDIELVAGGCRVGVSTRRWCATGKTQKAFFIFVTRKGIDFGMDKQNNKTDTSKRQGIGHGQGHLIIS